MIKHTILFLAANPVGTDRLALDKEARAIRVELERSGFRDSFALETRWAAEPLDLLRELRKLKPTVVHFSGHGSSDIAGARSAAAGPHRHVVVKNRSTDLEQHGLYFQGADGRPQLVSAEALAKVFGAAGSSVKLVTLSACYSDPQAAALVAHVDCVVGMRGSIRDDAARSFAIGFYGGLGERESVASAYRQGCAAISLDGLPDSHKPRLKVRDGVDAERVVLADRASRDPAVWSRGMVSPLAPAYADAEAEALSKQLENAQARRDKLRATGIATDEVDREILGLRRQLREGGQLRAGDSLGDGRYPLVRVAGRGGFAVVWEAYDYAEQQRVAIKVLHANLAGDLQRRERFFRGAQAMMKLAHPAVVRVLEPKGEDGGFYYFVMEFVPGGNLREVVLAQRVKRDDLLSIILQVGDALAVAHARSMVHRDIKPANILLDERGNSKLTDFDLVGAHDTTGGTRTGALGTVVYAAPECLEKPQDATARADVYGLGMTAIFCLSGRDLSMDTFRNPEGTIAKLDCSEHLREVLARAVMWTPQDRFADAGEMLNAFREAMRRGNAPAHLPWATATGRDSYGFWAEFEVQGVRQRMRWIPAGTFLMGSPETELGRSDDEGPQHRVTLTCGYWFGETPVTQALWIAVMGKNPSRFRGDRPEDMERPVEQVSWNDCRRFLDLLNRQVAGLAARLPTEAEWERACRAGKTTATWVGELSDAHSARALASIAWYAANSRWETQPVGRKAPNPYGLHDMLGNVWEWCADDMRQYTAVPVTDPVGGERDLGRVSRGGSWGNHARNVRAACRLVDSPGSREANLGLRLAGGKESALR